MAYTTDLTAAEFEIIEPLLPKPYIQTRPPKWSKHEILNGIFYQLINVCRWADLPKDLPPSGTVFFPGLTNGKKTELGKISLKLFLLNLEFNSWVEKCRVLWKNCERLISTSVAKLQLCLIRLQIKRLAREK